MALKIYQIKIYPCSVYKRRRRGGEGRGEGRGGEGGGGGYYL